VKPAHAHQRARDIRDDKLLYLSGYVRLRGTRDAEVRRIFRPFQSATYSRIAIFANQEPSCSLYELYERSPRDSAFHAPKEKKGK
jgi:hypothetical protein